MKKYCITALIFLASTAAFAQKKHKNTTTTTTTQDSVAAKKTPVPTTTTTPTQPAGKPKRDWSKLDLTKRAADHFMFDFPFKTDPRLSVGAGLGIGSSNIFFHQQEVLVAAYTNTSLAFPDESGGNHFKKYKLVTTYLEAPVELRFAVDPEHMDKSWKFAVGVKIGLLMSAYTKGKDLQSPTGQTLGNYIEKESSKEFFNSPKLAGTLRVSKGFIGVFGQFQANTLIKASAGPSVFPFSFGVVLSGL